MKIELCEKYWIISLKKAMRSNIETYDIKEWKSVIERNETHRYKFTRSL